MENCKHKCKSCGETWECDFPYYSSHQYFEEVVEFGQYCNAWCPSCETEKRYAVDKLFEKVAESGYLRRTQSILNQKNV